MRPKSLGLLWVRLGLPWVFLGQKGPIDGPKHRFNPLKTQLTPIFLTKNPPHPLSQIFQKKLTQIQPIQQKSPKWHVTGSVEKS